MRVLAIESSTELLCVAVADASGAVERTQRAGQTHSERALPLVEEVLAARGWSLADLDAIAFGAGPGAFTGVRIACGIAQGLALGAGKPVVAIGTLEALAEEAYARHGATHVMACLDARMHEVYVAAFEREGARWREVLAPAVLPPAQVAFPAGHWFGAGDGFDVAPSLAASTQLDGVDGALAPSARAVAVLARGRREAAVVAEQALPLYVRHRVALTTAERASGAKL
jgi:tRNA threonylcarbamoyladenosine biosynthesis protein TsaB